MKKYITFILIFVSIFTFSGCNETHTQSNSTSTADTGTSVNNTIESGLANESGHLQSEDQQETSLGDEDGLGLELEEIEWPNSGIATALSAPTWSKYGKIYSNSESMFWCDIENSSLDDFTSYIDICKESGFTNNQHYTKGYGYYAESEDGKGVQISYNQWGNIVGIEVRYDAENWDAYYKKVDVE